MPTPKTRKELGLVLNTGFSNSKNSINYSMKYESKNSTQLSREMKSSFFNANIASVAESCLEFYMTIQNAFFLNRKLEIGK